MTCVMCSKWPPWSREQAIRHGVLPGRHGEPSAQRQKWVEKADVRVVTRKLPVRRAGGHSAADAPSGA